jgi:protein gp37
MAENSKIEWCDHTFNPFIGCTKVSPGCDNCYAEHLMDKRMHKVVWGSKERIRTSPSNWRKPIAWNAAHDEFFAAHGRRQRVFCASLADVFDNAVDPAWRVDLFRLIESTPNLDWLLLTKRIGNAPSMSQVAMGALGCIHKPLPDNVWLGSTIVNQEEANRDIPKLLSVPAAKRFLSMEPLLGPVSLRWLSAWPENAPAPAQKPGGRTNHLDGLRQLDWVIVGGESGAGARPMHPDWARSLRDQCKAAAVPFLFKQWGEWTDEDWGERAGLRDTAGVLPTGEFALMSQGYVPPFDDGERLEAAGNVRLDGRMLMDRVGKRAAGRELDGVTHDGFPETLLKESIDGESR